MKIILAWFFSLSLAGSSLGLFQPQALTGDQVYDFMQIGMSHMISKLDALNEVLCGIDSRSTYPVLMRLLAASSECQQAISIVEYHFQTVIPYQTRWGRLVLDNLEAYNASATNVMENLPLKKALIQRLHPRAAVVMCEEVGLITRHATVFLNNINTLVTQWDSDAVAGQINAMHTYLLGKIKTVVDDCAPVGANSLDL